MADDKKHHHQDIQNNHALNDPANREAERVEPITPKIKPIDKKTAHKHEHRKNNLDVHAYEIPKPYDSMHSKESKQTHNYENQKNTKREK